MGHWPVEEPRQAAVPSEAVEPRVEAPARPAVQKALPPGVIGSSPGGDIQMIRLATDDPNVIIILFPEPNEGEAT